ncbi:MAG TPA: M23 family metallopeptidase [bacterium]|nr:M23 family metallopeptidase [bacterium]
MTYLFSNPQVKKWKTMFFLSFLLNIILIITFVLREHESDSVGENDDGIGIEESAENEKKESTKALSVVNIDENGMAETAKAGDLIVQSIVVEDNFYSAFSRSEDVGKVAEELKVSNLADLLGAHLARLLVWDMVLRSDVRKGDTCSYVFRVIPEDERVHRNDLPDIIEIIAVKYHSKKYAKDIKIFKYKPSNAKYSKYYYESGVMIEKIITPHPPIKDYIQVTSKIADRASKHDGIDFKSEIGTPVFSTVEGIVTRTNWMTKYNGYCIEIKEKDKQFTYKYLHLSDVLVHPGQEVAPGDHIANSGNTGKTTAPHLHYQINIGQRGEVLNPYVHHKVVFSKLKENDLEKFRQRVVDLESVFTAKRMD